jgi:hypothetical protein
MCPSLFRLKFGSGGILKKIVSDVTLEEGLEYLGITEISSLFRIEVDEDDDADLSFPGWIHVSDSSSHLTLTSDF